MKRVLAISALALSACASHPAPHVEGEAHGFPAQQLDDPKGGIPARSLAEVPTNVDHAAHDEGNR